MTVEKRLDRLERENRILKGAGSVVLLVLLAVAVMGASQKEAIPDVVKARAFHVIAKDGTALVKLEDSFGENVGFAGTVVTLNGKGKDLVQLGVSTGGQGVVTTLNGKGQKLVWLGVTISGEGTVTTLNGKGQKLVRIGVATKGAGTVVTLNGKGKDLVWLGATLKGAGVIITKNGKGKELVRIGESDPEGMGLVTAYDPSGRYGFGQLGPRN